MSESVYVAEVTPVHKITFSEEFNSSVTIKASLRPLGYIGSLKKSKSNRAANILLNVVFIAFSWVITVTAVPSAFFAPTRTFRPLVDHMP